MRRADRARPRAASDGPPTGTWCMCRRVGCPATTATTPDHDKLPYDSCAACIATAVLQRLARWLPDRAQRYQDVARETLNVLLADFLTPAAPCSTEAGAAEACRGRQAATGPVPAGGRDAVRQLLDRRVPLSRTVDRLVYSLARRQSLTRGEIARCVVLTRASG